MPRQEESRSSRRTTAHAVGVSHTDDLVERAERALEAFPNPERDVLGGRILDALVEIAMVGEEVDDARTDDPLDAIEILDHAARGPFRFERTADGDLEPVAISRGRARTCPGGTEARERPRNGTACV